MATTVLNKFSKLDMSDHDHALSMIKFGSINGTKYVLFDNDKIILKESLTESSDARLDDLELTKRLLGVALSFVNLECGVTRPTNN